MSNFDPASFLNTEVEAKFETAFTPVPEGDFPAQIVDVLPRTVNTKNGERIIVGIKWAITDQSVAEATGIDEPSVRQDLWIDMDDNGALATGVNQNIALGHLRDVLQQNNEGEAWSFAMLTGGVGTVRVKHRMTDNQRIMAEISEVTAA